MFGQIKGFGVDLFGKAKDEVETIKEDIEEKVSAVREDVEEEMLEAEEDIEKVTDQIDETISDTEGICGNYSS